MVVVVVVVVGDTGARRAMQIEKGVRKAMGISLTNAVVILDEAHNIEDACREAARCVCVCLCVCACARFARSNSSSSSAAPTQGAAAARA